MRKQTPHLSIEQLADYVEGRLVASDARAVEDHLATGCPTCQADLAWVGETLALMTGDDWAAPPAEVGAAVRRAYRQHYKPAAPAPTLGERLHVLFTPRVRWAMAIATTLVLLIAGGVVFRAWREGVVVQTATLTYVSEVGEVQPAGSDSWQPASSGTVIQVGDRIRTWESAEAILAFFDGSINWLGPSTELGIVQLSSQRDGGSRVVVLRQSLGQTYNRVQQLPSPDSRFEIETQAAVIAVRGAEFTVYVAHSGVTRVAVVEGRVEVTAQDVTVQVLAGQATTVQPGQPPPAPAPAPTPAPPEDLPQLPQPGPTRTEKPTRTLEPTETYEPTKAPEPTRTEKPTETSEPTRTEKPTRTPEPIGTHEPTEAPEPTETERPIEALEPTRTREPTETPGPTQTEEPTRTPKPTEAPIETSEPTRTTEPTETPEPTQT
ncbi:MAG: FecR domain-containing protein, partial [Anaerolineae bacterium]